MDYDKSPTPPVYEKGRALSPEVLKMWLDLVGKHMPGGKSRRIIDLGCGTGIFSDALATRFNASVIGIDKSERMLAQARVKSTTGDVVFARGDAESIPLADRSADMIFMSHVLHHLKNILKSARESYRVLKPGGAICIRNATIDTGLSFEKFFPSVRAMIQKEMMSRHDIIQAYESAGFTFVAKQPMEEQIAPNWNMYASKTEMKTNSFIERLPDAEFKEGMDALKTHAQQQDPTKPVVTTIDFFMFKKPK